MSDNRDFFAVPEWARPKPQVAALLLPSEPLPEAAKGNPASVIPIGLPAAPKRKYVRKAK